MSNSTEIRGYIEVRKVDGVVDEIVCEKCSFHLEQMNRGHWWIEIQAPSGQSLHINLSARNPRAKINVLAEFQ